MILRTPALDLGADFRVGRDQFPPLCCVCLQKADEESGYSFYAKATVRIMAPRCKRCGAEAKLRFYLLWFLMAAVGMGFVAAAMWTWGVSWSVLDFGLLLGVAALLIAPFAAYLATKALEPVSVYGADSADNLIQLRFANAEYTRLVAKHRSDPNQDIPPLTPPIKRYDLSKQGMLLRCLRSLLFHLALGGVMVAMVGVVGSQDWFQMARLLFAFSLIPEVIILWRVATRPQNFSCVLYADRLTCDCPVEILGSTFDLKLADIIQIEQPEESKYYYLFTRDGQRFTLTRSFGNPAKEFIDELQRLQPKIKLIGAPLSFANR